jgi:hypothetical protein
LIREACKTQLNKTVLAIVMAFVILVPLGLFAERAWLVLIAKPVTMRVSSVTLYTRQHEANPNRPVTYDFFAEFTDPVGGKPMRCMRYVLMGKHEIVGKDIERRAYFAALPGKEIQGYYAVRNGKSYVWVESNLLLGYAMLGFGVAMAALLWMFFKNGKPS